MTSETVDVTVVICAYTEERWHDLVAAVDSVQRQIAVPREIIVVADHNAHLLERARAHLPGVVVIENGESQGLSGARNSGIARAHGAYIAFLDDDATAEPDWLARLSHCCEDPQVLGVGGTVEPEWLSSRPAWFPEEFYWVIGCTYQLSLGKPVVVRNPFGGCTCYRREVFEVVGGFKHQIGRVPTRPMGCEETELCIRAKQHWSDKVFLYEPEARIHHHIPAQRASWHYFRSRCYAEGLSKALVTRYVGAKDGLASERAYTLQTLPRGVIRGLMDGFLRLDLAGFLRAGTIISGLMMTIAGYLVGKHSQRIAVPRSPISQEKEVTSEINRILIELEQEGIS
jgi:glucosyl-dolichyl phosphate glucuronosyltransferase